MKKDNLKKQPLNTNTANSNGDFTHKAQRFDTSKFPNNRSDTKSNFDNSNIKTLEDSSEEENVSHKQSHTEASLPVENQKKANEVKNFHDSQTTTTNTKLNPLKSLSSSLKPNLFKSIGVQVGSSKG